MTYNVSSGTLSLYTTTQYMVWIPLHNFQRSLYSLIARFLMHMLYPIK